jgi:hypothetical protein
VKRLRLTAIGIAGLLLPSPRTTSATCAGPGALKLANTTIIATKYRIDDDPTSGVIRTRPVCPHPLGGQC